VANLLKMAIVQSIQTLFAQGWSQRRIARELDIDRGTVRKYLGSALGGSCGAKPAILPTGSEGPKPAILPMAPAPAAAPIGSGARAPGPEPAILPTGSEADPPPAEWPAAPAPGVGSAGRRSDCEPYRELILAKLRQELTSRRIWQDLTAEHGATLGYDSVRRYVRRLGGGRVLPFRRMECEPGQEAQVDFGRGAWIVAGEGRRRRSHVFRVVLSHSRKGYSEATFTQTAEDFLGALENAFHHFGGVPRTLVIDNLKAAVAHPDWFDPELNPKLQSFCRHYGTVILPTRPRTPRHKGKVERGIGYVKGNALKARQFAGLPEENQHLAQWEASIADTRVHGTTKQQVGRLFREAEQPALLPLPRERFPFFHEARRKVNRDGHVEVARAYYSAPPEYLGREVWVRWDARLVRLFNHRFEQVAVHVRHERGRFSTHAAHLHPHKINGLERGAGYLLGKLSAVGPQTDQWAQAMLHARGIEGTRVLQGLLALMRKHPREALEKACETALSHGAFRLRTIRQLLARQAARQEPLPFLEEHPLIRPLDDYAAVVAQALRRQPDRPSLGEGFTRHDWTEERAPEKRPGDRAGDRQGAADVPPPRPGYPLRSCSPAEPRSVSPDAPSAVRRSPLSLSPPGEFPP
jgi:transposase